MKIVATKKRLIIASASIGLIGGLAVVSTGIKNEEVSVEREVNGIKGASVLNERAENIKNETSKADNEGIKAKEEKKEVIVQNSDSEIISNEQPEQKMGSQENSTQKKPSLVTAPAESTPAEEVSPPAKPSPKISIKDKEVSKETVTVKTLEKAPEKAKVLPKPETPPAPEVKENTKKTPSTPAKAKPSTPVEEKPPTPPAQPAPIIQNVMNRSQAEGHMSPHVHKSGNGFNLMSGSGRYSIIVEFPTSNSGKAQMSVDGVNYNSGYDIQPGDFGQAEYDATKAHFAQMNRAIQAYADTQFGVGSKDANALVAEIKRMTLDGNNGETRKLTLQGAVVSVVKEGVRTSVYY